MAKMKYKFSKDFKEISNYYKYLVNKTDISVLNSNEKGVLYLITCDKKDKNKRLILKFCVKNSKTLKK